MEATFDQKVGLLEEHRADLVRQKHEVEGKLAELRARMEATGQGEGAGGGEK